MSLLHLFENMQSVISCRRLDISVKNEQIQEIMEYLTLSKLELFINFAEINFDSKILILLITNLCILLWDIFWFLGIMLFVWSLKKNYYKVQFALVSFHSVVFNPFLPYFHFRYPWIPENIRKRKMKNEVN